MTTLSLGIQQGIVLFVTLAVVTLLFFEKIRPALVFFGAVLLFLLSGIIGTGDFLKALANESIISIFLLIFITAGLKEHFNIIGALDKLLGKTSSPRTFLLRMTSGVAALSAFLNNTPIVALFMPYAYQWARKNNTAPSKLLIPLSYAAIIGGMITVIGTSTNLVLNGLIISKNATPLGLLDFLIPGLMVSVGGVLFMYFWGYKLLPNHIDVLKSVSKQSREYLVETVVPISSSLIGKSIAEANLRNLTGIYLFEIVRRGKVLTPVEPTEVISAEDSLFFAGETEHIMHLLARDSELELPTPANGKSVNGRGHNLVEAVIPVNSELVGRTLKQIGFRENFDAAVVAIHRNGEKLRGKIGEIEMQAGDLMLISTGRNFQQLLSSRPALYLVSIISRTSESKPAARRGFWIVIALTIGAMLTGIINLFLGLLVITGYMMVAKLLTVSEIKKQLDIDLLIILIASLTFSTAIIDTGAAELVAGKFIPAFSAFGNFGIIAGLYLVTLLLTTFVTHVAAVSIVFPIAYALGSSVPGISMTALFVAIAFAASASFHAPFSYQTNLMVYGPGGYKFKDFLRVGLPFTLFYSILTLTFIAFYYKM
jgi:di/tricarboxylate transporter